MHKAASFPPFVWRGDLFSVEAVAADKFADNACRGNFVVNVGFADVVQDLYHSANAVVAFVCRVDGGEERIDVLFKHRKLIDG